MSIEFVSENEAREVLGDYVEGVLDDYSFIVNIENKKETVSIPEKKFLIFSVLGNKKLYLASSGTTFNYHFAKKFSKEDANKKTTNMNKHGKYVWTIGRS